MDSILFANLMICGDISMHLHHLLQSVLNNWNYELLSIVQMFDFLIIDILCITENFGHVSRLSLLEMHSGGEAAGDLMLSCLTGCLQWKLWPKVLFLTGTGSAWQHLQVAVLALLVLLTLAVPNALMHNELNYWAGRYVCTPWTV